MTKATLTPLSFAILGSISTIVNANTQEEKNDPHKLSTIVVSAAGYEQKIQDAPATMSVVTKEDLSKKPYLTLLDAVRDVEGIDIGETNDKTGQGSISMRGMGSDYTLILVDGKRQNNHGDIYPNSFGGNQFNHIPPLDSIERIEIIRGPASTLYGSDALGGVINIITKKVTDTWSGSATIAHSFEENKDFGDDQTIDFNLMGPLIAKKLGLTLRGSQYKRDPSNPTYDPVIGQDGQLVERELGFGGGGRTVKNTNYSYGGRLSWNISDNQALWFDIDTSEQKYDNNEGQLGTIDSLSSIWRTTKVDGKTVAAPRVGYTGDQKFTRDTWSINHEGDWDFGKSFVSLQHISTENHGRTLPFSVDERQELLEIIQGTGTSSNLSEKERKKLAEDKFLPRQKRTLESKQYTLDAKLDIPFEAYGEHMAVIGTQIIRGTLNDGVFGLENGAAGATQKHNMWSIFAEDTWNITNPFALTTGLRYDKHEVFGDHFSPRLYGVYNLNDELTIKGGVSTGFKTPKTTQLYDGIVGFGGQGTSPQFGNPELKPEKSVSTELALYWNSLEGHSFNATIFHNKFNDKIASQGCGPDTNISCANAGDYSQLGYSSSSKNINIDKVIIQGLEVGSKIQILDPLALKMNYTYTDSEQKSGDNKGLPLGDTAKHITNATLEWQPTDIFSTFLTAEYRGKRLDVSESTIDDKTYFKGYTVLNLGGSYKVNDNLRVNARINNLLNKDFTSYTYSFNDDGDIVYRDDYNNKYKNRSYWLSLNLSF